MDKLIKPIFKLTCLCLAVVLNSTTAGRTLTGNLLSTATTPAAQPSSATAAGENSDTHMSFFMHDSLGGTNPSTKPVTGVASNIYNSRLPFAKPLGLFPPSHGIPLPNSNPNLPISNPSTVPFFIEPGGHFPAEITPTTLQGLEFGTITEINDDITKGHEMGSSVVGKAHGLYVASSEDGSSQMIAFTAMFEGGNHGDSLSFFGVHRTASSESHIAVIGGAGKYHNANGYAVIHKIIHNDAHESEGVDATLGFIVYLSD